MTGRSRSWKLLVLVTLVILLIAVTTSAAMGQGTDIRISPPSFELEAKPGQVVTQEIVVSNRGDASLPFTMQASGFAPTGTGGQAMLTEEESGIVAWTSVSPKEFLLGPGEDQVVTFLIDVPSDAPPGGHYVSILASLGNGGATTGGLSVGQRIGSLVLLRVAGKVIEDMELASFTAPGLAAKGPVTFKVLARNSGNVHVRPAAVIILKDTFGGEITQIPVEQQRVLPGSERAFTATWDAGWRMGIYTAEYLASYGSKNAQINGTIRFVIFPWPIAVPVLAMLALFIFSVVRGRRRLARTFNVLVGKE